jgi:CRISPR/Cas system-associated endonuclease Cas1
MLEPGTRVSHAACALAARVGTLLVWIGEAGVRLYSAGQPGGARSDRLLYQAKLALDDELRLKVVRKMYALRFGENSRNADPSSNCAALKAHGCARCTGGWPPCSPHVRG